jgi:hypothetical protein
MTMDARRSPGQPRRKPSWHLSPMLDVASMKVRQRSKIEEIQTALLRAGALTLDKQAEVLGLSRSTTWSNYNNGNHRGCSGVQKNEQRVRKNEQRAQK